MVGGGQARSGGGSASREFDLRRAALGSIGALLLQFLLGLAASLWVTIAPVHPWSHIGGEGLFAVHALFGVAIAAMALVTLARALDKPGSARLWAAIAVVGVVVAIVAGLEFVSSAGSAGWSFAMGCGWAAALLANVRLALGA